MSRGRLRFAVDTGGTFTDLVVAEPEFPGITGGVTLTINTNGIITNATTPGADAAGKSYVYGGDHK